MAKVSAAKQEAIKTLTAEKERIEFAVLPRHPIYGPADDIHINVHKAAIEDASRVQENSSGHHVANFAKYKRLHSLLCDLANGMKNRA
jgi:hypothetical protein